MTRYKAIMLPVLLLVLAGCFDIKELAQEEIQGEGVYGASENLISEPQPENIPVLDATNLGGWIELCSECHAGPAFSSQTHLSWAHCDTCDSQSSCLGCHGEHLHRMDVRGSKQICVDCHVRKKLPLNCDHCHVEGWEEMNTPPDHTLRTHSAGALEESAQCDTCHGSKAWCTDCHGVEMPHPGDVLEIHGTLVRGDPDSCIQCHGKQACEQCHNERGVGFD